MYFDNRIYLCGALDDYNSSRSRDHPGGPLVKDTPFNFPGGSDGKESACNVGDLGSVPGLGRSPGEGNSCPLQSSCLENSMDRGAGYSPWGHKVRHN